jgi:site-specific DNA recombinase
LNKRATETDLRLKRLNDAIESGVVDLDDAELNDGMAALKLTRDQAHVDADRATASLDNSSRKSITPQMLSKFAHTARERMRMERRRYRRDHLRALTRRVAVDTDKVRIMGSMSNLLQTLAVVAGTGTKLAAVPSLVPKWCTRRDSNPWPPD